MSQFTGILFFLGSDINFAAFRILIKSANDNALNMLINHIIFFFIWLNTMRKRLLSVHEKNEVFYFVIFKWDVILSLICSFT